MMKIISMVRLKTMLFTLALGLISVAAFAEEQEIADLLSQKNAPDGVVFELLGSEDGNYLPAALKKIETYKKQLRAKFPQLEIAVVSHGAEQFELMASKVNSQKESHLIVQRLVDADIPVHICETHASWRDVTAEDFPAYISPSPQGPIQIKQYQELGYTLIEIE